MTNFLGRSDVYIIVCYHGKVKPDADSFLFDFIEDYLKYSTISFKYEGVEIKVQVRCFVMDSPAKSFILQIKGHSGYFSCTKCNVEGTYIDHKVVFPIIDAEKKSNESFRERKHPLHHKTLNQTQLERLDIDMVKQINVDSMHCIYLGIFKQLMKQLLIGPKEYRISLTDRKRKY